ncbi:MAG: UvrD-helicase domain-containing protein [Kofleriaceae bacterium]|nr:UvrD-helicase domain-containing protein [Kofleriaceae bacterium]
MTEPVAAPTLDTYYPKPAQLPAAAHRLVVVEASAGTGKTFFLEHRVVDLIIEQGATLAQILLVTFTEKATEELRRRIRNIVDTVERSSATARPAEGPAWHITPTVRAQLATARADFGQASIFTIHGFCQRMLVEDAFTAGRLFEQTRIADAAAFEVAFYALLREDLARDPESRQMLKKYLAQGGSVEALCDLLLSCARLGHCALRLLPSKAALLDAAQTVLTASIDGTWEHIIATIKNGNSVKAACSRFDTICQTVKLLVAQPDIVEFELVATLAEVIQDAAWFSLPKTAAVTKTAIAAYPTLVAALATLSKGGTFEEYLVGLWLPRALERMAANKAELAQFDYQDLLKHLWEALSGPRGDALASAIRAKLPWALIDEFQDTDDLQWNIFRRIWMHEDARGLTIVGDPKQSIYSFRGADVAVYLAAREELEKAGAIKVVLSDNFRSTPQLVDGVNLLLGVGTATPLFGGAVTYDVPSRAAGHVTVDAAEPAIFVMQPPVPATGKSTVSRERDFFAAGIAEEVARLLAAPLTWLEHGVAQRLRPSDIMVLTRSGTESNIIAQLLAARGVATSRKQQEKLFATREARELSEVFDAIARPRDRGARLRALRSRYFAVSWHELAELGAAPDHHPLYALLTHWQQLAQARRFDALFHSLLEDSGMAVRTIALCGPERALVNTQHVLDLLAECTAARPMEFHEVSELLRGWISAGADSGDDEMDVQRIETDGEAVQIMTVHRAKGLEAAVVFLYGGATAPPTFVKVFAYHDDDKRQLAVGKQSERVKALIDRDADQENRRLVYVAMTRAKIRLYLPQYTKLSKHAAYHCLSQPLLALAGAAADSPARGLLRFVAAQAEPAVGEAPVPAAAGRGSDADADADADAESDETSGDHDDGELSDAALQVVAALPSLPPPTLMPWMAGAAPTLPRRQTHGELLSYSKLARQAAALAAAEASEATVIDGALLSQKEVGDEVTSGIEVAAHELPPGAASGLLVHDVLEKAIVAMQRGDVASSCVEPASDSDAFASLPLMAKAAQYAATARGITAPEHVRHALLIAHRMLSQPLVIDAAQRLPALSQAAHLAAEVEFWFPAGAHRFVRGAIDAVVSWDGETLWIVDYKTDVLDVGVLAASPFTAPSTAALDCDVEPTHPAAIAVRAARLAAAQAKVNAKYGLQAAVYNAAVARMLTPTQRIGGVLFCFVRYGLVVPTTLTSDALAAAQRQWELRS